MVSKILVVQLTISCLRRLSYPQPHKQLSLSRVPKLCMQLVAGQRDSLLNCSLTDAPIVLLGSEETVHEDDRSMLRISSFRRFMDVERK